MGKIVASLPADAHPQIAMDMLRAKYDLPDVFYVDTWPLSFPILVIADPIVAASVTQAPSLAKHYVVQESLRGLVGTRSLFSKEGPEWRTLRSMFNPGFSLTQLMTQVPDIADHIMVFREKLSKWAETGEVFPMGEAVTLATMDVISEVVMGYNFNSQRVPNSIVDRFQTAISWTFEHTNIIGKMKGIPMMWWHTRRLDQLIGQAIQERYEKREFETIDKRAVIDLAFQAYNEQKFGAADKVQRHELDPDFLKIAIDHSKVFILGGHDTTASTTSVCVTALASRNGIRR